MQVGNYAKVLECFERMKVAGFSPNQITYTPMVDALFKLQRDDEAMEMFDEMRSQGVQPLSMTYGVMLVVCSRNDMVRKITDFMTVTWAWCTLIAPGTTWQGATSEFVTLMLLKPYY